MVDPIIAVIVVVGAVVLGFIAGRAERPDSIVRNTDAKLPPGVAYAGAIQVIAYATTGEYGDTNVPYLRAMTALERYEADHDLDACDGN